MEPIKETLKRKTVNSSNKYKSTVNGNNSYTVADKIDAAIREAETTPEGVAKYLSESLDDTLSEKYYLILAKENHQGKLLEALSITKEAANNGKIRTKKAIYFQGILRHWGIKTKFKKD